MIYIPMGAQGAYIYLSCPEYRAFVNSTIPNRSKLNLKKIAQKNTLLFSVYIRLSLTHEARESLERSRDSDLRVDLDEDVQRRLNIHLVASAAEARGTTRQNTQKISCTTVGGRFSLTPPRTPQET